MSNELFRFASACSYFFTLICPEVKRRTGMLEIFHIEIQNQINFDTNDTKISYHPNRMTDTHTVRDL